MVVVEHNNIPIIILKKKKKIIISDLSIDHRSLNVNNNIFYVYHAREDNDDEDGTIAIYHCAQTPRYYSYY